MGDWVSEILIDVILINVLKDFVKSDVFDLGLSDYVFIYIFMKERVVKCKLKVINFWLCKNFD